MKAKLRFVICVSLCTFLAFISFVGISYSEDRKTGDRKDDSRKQRREVPEFKYDENSKKYILDTPKFMAEFMPSSFTYIPKGKSGEGKPVTFSLEGFYQGGEKIYASEKIEPSTRLTDENKILIFDKKDYRELYESVMRGFVQVYVIESLPYMDKDLVIKAQLSTEYSLVPNDEEGFSIKDGNKTITVFKQRVAIDSQSKSLLLKTILQKDMLEITVPRDYLSEAKFPIVIISPQKGRTVSTSAK